MSIARIDHLVVVAPSLADGVAWCEATLGVTPGPGGEHPLMGTHNRLLRIATVDHPRAYFEIIAVNPADDGGRRRAGRRWFDMDDESLRAEIQRNGPRLVHFVANLPDVGSALAALRRLGIDRGEAVQASRMTPRGLLEWQITVREDGQRLFDGCLPTLIEWGATHPAGAAELRAAYDAIGMNDVAVSEGRPNLCATLATPKGRVRLESEGS